MGLRGPVVRPTYSATLARTGGWVLILACACACSSGEGKSGDSAAAVADGGDGGNDGADGGTDGADGAGDGGDSGDEDHDGDGFVASEDCDDRDPLTHPDAPEEWNAVDDDCDGRVDANGDYEGVLDLRANAIYMGEAYAYRVSCPGLIQRTGPALRVDITCSPNLDEPNAELLLGETVTIQGDSDSMSGAEWTGSLDVAGNGWSSRVEAAVVFVDFGDPQLVLALDAVSLSLSGTMSTALVE